MFEGLLQHFHNLGLEPHPGVCLIAGGLLAALTRGVWRKLVLLAFPVLALLLMSLVHPGMEMTFPFMGTALRVMEVSSTGLVFGWVFCLVAFLGTVYALHVRPGLDHFSALVYAGAALGVVLAGDWITVFIFWEVMGAASTLLIWCGRSNRATAAGYRYEVLN